MLKAKELKRATSIEACINGQCTVKQVATILGLSEHRIKQIKREVKENGVKSIQHGNRGRKPKNTISDETKKKILELRINKITNMEQANKFLINYIEKYNSRFSVEPISKKTTFLKLPKRYNLDELLCVRFERTIDNAGVFSINNSKFQILDKSLPPKTKIQVYISQKIGMRVKLNNKIYDVEPLEMISKDQIDNNKLDYHQWLPNVVIELINEYYLKDAKAP